MTPDRRQADPGLAAEDMWAALEGPACPHRRADRWALVLLVLVTAAGMVLLGWWR